MSYAMFVALFITPWNIREPYFTRTVPTGSRNHYCVDPSMLDSICWHARHVQRKK